MLLGKINREELDFGGFFVECTNPPKSGCCTAGKQYPVHIKHEAGFVNFVMPYNDNDEPYLINIGERFKEIEGVFEVVR